MTRWLCIWDYIFSDGNWVNCDFDVNNGKWWWKLRILIIDLEDNFEESIEDEELVEDLKKDQEILGNGLKLDIELKIEGI